MVTPFAPVGPWIVIGVVTKRADGPKVGSGVIASGPPVMRKNMAGPLAVSAGANRIELGSGNWFDRNTAFRNESWPVE